MSRVSAVINVYSEAPEYIAEAIASVRMQSRPVDEIIVVDDGAKRDYAALWRDHPDVRVIRQENAGLAAARNTGLKAATGDFILFLDGDDRLMREAVAINLAALGDHPEAVMAYGGWRYIDPDGAPHPPANMRPMGPDAYAAMLEGNCIGMHATVLYRRDALVRAGGFNAGYRACEDYELYLRLTREGQVRSTPRLLAEYRQHGANMSGDHAMMLRTLLKVLDEQAPYLHDRPQWQAAHRRGVAEAKAHYARQQYVDILNFLASGKNGARIMSGAMRMTRIAPRTMGVVMVTEFVSRLRAAINFAKGVPGVGQVEFGQLRRTIPVSRWFGFDRGLPVDRKYIEAFLSDHAADIRGRVLEAGDNTYTRQFGGDRVTSSEIVLHVDRDVEGVAYIADLTDGAGLPDAAFDCVIMTQTLHFIYDMPAAVRTLKRVLKPGGVLLVTTPGVSSVDNGEWDAPWCWSLTAASLRRLLADAFGDQVELESYGNVLVATAFLHGLAASELTDDEFAVRDPRYPVILGARVRNV